MHVGKFNKYLQSHLAESKMRLMEALPRTLRLYRTTEGPTAQLTVGIEQHTRDRLKALAKRHKTSQAVVITELVTKAFDEMAAARRRVKPQP